MLRAVLPAHRPQSRAQQEYGNGNREAGGRGGLVAAGINEAVSPHWLRHAHGLHAIDHGASLPEVQATLGHGNISTTSGYLHARPDSSSGLRLDPGVFLR